MTELFLEILNMSVRASWVILAVLALRLLLRKGPTWFPMALWVVTAIRLVCPLSIRSSVSLIPSSQTVAPSIMPAPQPTIDSGIPMIDQMINPVILDALSPAVDTGMHSLQFWVHLSTLVWVLGIIVLLGYMIFSYCRLHHRVRNAAFSEGRIYFSEKIRSPFVLGILKPNIYLPYKLAEADRAHVLSHELTHIRRLDHWWKPIGFLILTLHWFNPLVWLAYILLCKDIEVACDKAVVKQLSPAQRADYAQALLNCCAEHSRISACPIAFGEISIKERVKNVLNYKKPTFWLILVAAIVCVAAVFCLLTDPNNPAVPTDPSSVESTPTEPVGESSTESTPAEPGEGPYGLPTPQV